MAAAIGNPLGYVSIFDGGTPRLITGYARAILSGGVFAFGSDAGNVVSSGANSYVATDIQFAGDASGTTCNGVVVQSAASGAPVVIATRGVIIALADGTVTPGGPVSVAGVNGVRDTTTGSVGAREQPIGRALTGATSGNFCLVHLNL